MGEGESDDGAVRQAVGLSRTPSMPNLSTIGEPGVSRTPYIQAANIRKLFQRHRVAVEAIASVTFNIAANEFVSVVGPSGCGKSTLLMILAGLELATSGTIEIGGRPVTTPRTQFGLIFQDPTLLPWKSALDNVLFPIKVLGLPLDGYRRRAETLLEFRRSRRFQASASVPAFRRNEAACRDLPRTHPRAGTASHG